MYYNINKYLRNDFGVVKTQFVEQNKLMFERVDTSDIKFDGKSVVILCGNDTRSQSRGEFYAYLCNNWLGDAFYKPDLTMYSIYYPNKQPLFNEDSHFSLDYETLAKTIFKQAVVKDNKIQSAEEIKKNLSNVVFFGHSAGGFVMNELMNSFGKMLTDLHFSKSDIKNIYSGIVFMAYAPYSLVNAPIKSIYVAPIHDSIGSSKLVYKKLLNSKSIFSSAPSIDIWGENRLTSRTYPNFLRHYEKAMNGKQTVYYASDDSLIATPNLLYFDGKKEDHNFAGAVIYPAHNPHQTDAGRNTAQFLGKALNYCLTTPREKFNTLDLYEKTVGPKLTNYELHK